MLTFPFTQSMLALVHIRRSHHLFPIRPYLPSLIDGLEDSDANVRECAKQSVVELFTGPAVTDAARADLKKELTKKNVRKGIVESVLNQVAARASATATPAAALETSNDTSVPTEDYVPPSMALMSRKASSAVPGPSGVPRTASGNFAPRPMSRTASVSASAPAPSTMPPTPTEVSASDVKIVYVSLSLVSSHQQSVLSSCSDRIRPRFGGRIFPVC
jgi:CLIP-associating protein 1/2